MKQLALSVYDDKAECFGHPFFTSAIGIATRMLAEWANNDQSIVGRHPEDFTLYQVGFWDDHAAKMESLDTPKFIAKANEFANNGKGPKDEG